MTQTMSPGTVNESGWTTCPSCDEMLYGKRLVRNLLDDLGEVPMLYVTAPMVSVFYRAPEPGAQPFVSRGDTVTAGQQVGLVEAMKLLIPVTAEEAGRVAEMLRENGDTVEYGDRLYELVPDDNAGRAS